MILPGIILTHSCFAGLTINDKSFAYFEMLGPRPPKGDNPRNFDNDQ
jgi:hypothetical protein